MRFFGTPTKQQKALITDRESLMTALRNDDVAAQAGAKDWSRDTEQEMLRMSQFLGAQAELPNIPINQFSGFYSYMHAASKKVWALGAACHILAVNVQQATYMLGREDNEGNIAQGKVKFPPELRRLLKKLNPNLRMRDAVYQWVWHMELCGCAYWLKDRIDGAGRPHELYPLLPHMVSPIPDSARGIKGYEYRVNGSVITFAPEEIIHWRNPSPLSSIKGLGAVERAEPLFNDFINRQLLTEFQQKNGGSPAAVLALENSEEISSSEDFAKLRASYEERYGGIKNSGKQRFLSGKWNLLKLGMTPREMEEADRSKQSVEHVFINAMIPLSVAGFGSANYATAKREEITFRKTAIWPKVETFVDGLNDEDRGLVGKFVPGALLFPSLQGMLDIEQIAKDLTPFFDRGAITPNEMRVAIGYQKSNDPMMDKFFLSGQPIELAGVADVPDYTAADPADGADDGDGADSAEEAKTGPKKPKKPKKDTQDANNEDAVE